MGVDIRRRLSTVLTTAVILLGAVGCGGSSGSAPTESGPVKIGLLMSLTGAASVQAAMARRGAELAAATLSAGGGRQVTLVIQDDQSDPQAGVSGFNQLVDSEGLKAIVGPGPSAVALALKPIANSKKVVLMAPGVGTPAFATENGYTYRTWLPVDLLEASTAKYATTDLKLRKVAMLLQDSVDARSYGAAVKTVFEKAGGQVVGQEFVAVGQADFESQLTKLIGAQPDALLIELLSPASLGNAFKQARQLGFKGQMLTSNIATNAAFLTAAGTAAEGAIYSVTVVPDPTDANYKAFVTAYQTKYGQAPDILAANGYDCVAIMARAVEQTGNNGPGIKAWLGKLKNYKGVSGTINFKSNGDVASKPYAVYTIKDGKAALLITGT